jgi:hypothetical protein
MPDLLRRFTLTPLENTFDLHGVSVKVATNSQVLADRLLRALPLSAAKIPTAPGFIWRVVVEPEDDLESQAMAPSGYRMSHEGLAFITIGQKHFLACDLQAHEGISFVSENIASDERLFRECFLPGFTTLVKESLEWSR